ncbi:MAG: hypothetical protein QNL04_08945 [SAR324 cluster bacterium]|nr:hypothetical protein [SAR324 cluster bacterium]
MDIIEIGEGSFIITTPEMNYVLYRSNIPIRLDSETLVYMVKVEAEKDGFKSPIQAKVSLEGVIDAVKNGASSTKAMIVAIRPIIVQMWGEEDAKIFDALV